MILVLIVQITIDANSTLYYIDCDFQPERDQGVIEPTQEGHLDGAHPQEDLVSKDGCSPTFS